MCDGSDGAYGSFTTCYLIYGPGLACQVTIQGYIYVAPPLAS
jgi:hypothetical protein